MQKHRIDHEKLKWDTNTKLWVIHIDTINYYLGEHYSAIYLPYIMEEFRDPSIYVQPTKLCIITKRFNSEGLAL